MTASVMDWGMGGGVFGLVLVGLLLLLGLVAWWAERGLE